MDLLDQLRLDYQRFPADQSYHLYAEAVYFKDPLTAFRGVERYQAMIAFMARWFRSIHLDLHQIEYTSPQEIRTRWTLSWVAPLPWQPAMAISGHSQLQLDPAGKIIAHIDHWDCSPWAVFRQLWRSTKQPSSPF